MSDTEERGPQGEDTGLAAILANILERRRAGESPTALEYIAAHPELREEILESVQMMELLDDAAVWDSPDLVGHPQGSNRSALAPEQAELEVMIADYAPILQRLIYLRTVEQRRWSDIAGLLEKPERELRLMYVRTIRDLLRRART